MIVMSLFHEVSYTHQFPSYNFFGLVIWELWGSDLTKFTFRNLVSGNLFNLKWNLRRDLDLFLLLEEDLVLQLLSKHFSCLFLVFPPPTRVHPAWSRPFHSWKWCPIRKPINQRITTLSLRNPYCILHFQNICLTAQHICGRPPKWPAHCQCPKSEVCKYQFAVGSTRTLNYINNYDKDPNGI